MGDNERDIYSVEVAGVKRDLVLFEVAPGVRIAIVNILGDTELVVASAAALAEKLAAFDTDLIISAEAKSIPLLFELAKVMDKPWIVLRKSHKPYMGDTLSAETMSITTGKPQTLYVDQKDRRVLDGAKVVIIDDVISTGSTLQSMQ